LQAAWAFDMLASRSRDDPVRCSVIDARVASHRVETLRQAGLPGIRV